MQVVLPLLLVRLLLAVLQPVDDLRGLGGPGLPHISGAVGQSHGCESNNLRSQGARSHHQASAHSCPMWSSQHPWGAWFVGWAFMLQWAERGMEAGAGQGPG